MICCRETLLFTVLFYRSVMGDENVQQWLWRRIHRPDNVIFMRRLVSVLNFEYVACCIFDFTLINFLELLFRQTHFNNLILSEFKSVMIIMMNIWCLYKKLFLGSFLIKTFLSQNLYLARLFLFLEYLHLKKLNRINFRVNYQNLLLYYLHIILYSYALRTFIDLPFSISSSKQYIY